MFGPAWINFYGSPREFSELSDEYEKLNFDVVRKSYRVATRFIIGSYSL